MKIHVALMLVYLISCASGLFAASSDSIEFSGMMTFDGKTLIFLTNTNTGVTRWVAVGAKFEDYLLVDYDSKKETVALSRDNEMSRLSLKTAKIKPAEKTVLVFPEGSMYAGSSLTASGGPLDANAFKEIGDNLRLLRTAADYYYSKGAKTTASYEDLVGPGKPIKAVIPRAGEDYSRLGFRKDGTTYSVTTAKGVVITFEYEQPAATKVAP